MKNSRSSLLLMLLPVFAILAFGWWRQMNPPEPPPNPLQFGLNLNVTKEPIYPVDVWRGRDTKLSILCEPNGPLPAAWNINGVEWLQCLRLVARKNGRDRTLFCRGVSDDYESYRRWLPARNGNEGGNYGSIGASTSMALALRKVPHEWGELWLRLDMGLRPGNVGVRDVDAPTVTRLKAQGSGVWASESVLLRRTGEMIKMPVVSTNPQLEIDAWHIEPSNPASGSAYEDKQLVIQLFDTGQQPQNEKSGFSFQAGSDWQIVDEKGVSLGNYGGQPAMVEKGKDVRQYTAKFPFSSRLAPKAHQLRVRGQLSCNKRWPLKINILLLDRTKTASKLKSRSR